MSFAAAIRSACVLVVVCLGACATRQPAAPADPQFTRANVSGLVIDTTNPRYIDLYRFSPRGWAIESFVDKKTGESCPPAYDWRVRRGRLQFSRGRGREREIDDEWTLVSRDRDKLVVRRRDGQISEFKILEESPGR